MACVTVIPTAEANAVDPCRTDTTRPEPHPSTPPLTNTADTAAQSSSTKPHQQSSKTSQTETSKSVGSTIHTPPSSQSFASDNNDTSDTTQNPNPQTNFSETITFIARSDEDLIAALQLISDSVAQQRQIAARALLFHPAYWSVLLLTLPYFYVEWYHDSSDRPVIIIVWVGLFMSTMAIIKIIVRGYIDAAEKVGRWSWLYGDRWIQNRFRRRMNLQSTQTESPPAKQLSNARVDPDPDFKTDYVFVTRLGEKIIAALVVRMTNTWQLNPRKPLPFERKGDHLQKKAIIRAWAVERRYRGHGIGIALLRFVVRWCLNNEIEGPEFSDAHAHSVRVLPLWVTPNMDMQDRRARTKLYWEIQHYTSPWWQEQRGEKSIPQERDLQQRPDKKGEAACEYAYSLGTEHVLRPRSKGGFSLRRQIETSRAITKQILKDN